MLSTVCLLTAVVVWLAALGRSATPRHERLPWTRWTIKDLIGNTILGARRLAELQERNPLTPHRCTPRDQE